jgi:TonB family protein
MGIPAVVGRLPTEVVNRALRAGLGKLRQCYEAALRQDPTLRGAILLRFDVDPAGTVRGVRVVQNDLGSSGVDACVARVVGGIAFPQPESGAVHVTVPLTFSPP